jgi:hypothetical protein
LPRFLKIMMAYLAIPVLLLFNWWMFKALFGVGYYRWYLNNGALIGVATGFIALIWEDLEGREGLVALNPVEYFGAALQLAGVVAYSIGTSLTTPSRQQEKAGCLTQLAIIWDALASTFLGMLMLAAVLVWLVVASPLQWVVTIFAGAPARRQLRGGMARTVVVEEGNQMTIGEARANQPAPRNVIDVSLARKPFAVTQALIALIFFLMDAIWKWMT